MNVKHLGKKVSGLSKRSQALLVLGVLGILGIGSAASLSYFTDRGIMTNDFTTGTVNLTETETDWDPDDEEPGPDGQKDGENTYPGYTRYKNPTIQNTAGIEKNDAWVKATITFYDQKGEIITDKARNDLIYETLIWDPERELSENTSTAGGYTKEELSKFAHFNPAFLETEETDRENGGKYVYYLEQPLKSAATKEGGDSVTLFNVIAYPTEWSQNELDLMGDYHITIKFEGIQTWTFKDVFEAMEALNGEIANETSHSDYEQNTENKGGDDFTHGEKLDESIAKCMVTLHREEPAGEVTTKTVKVQKGGTYGAALPTLSMEGYTFAGWFTEAKGAGTKVTSDMTCTEDIDLFASWTVSEKEPTEETDDTEQCKVVFCGGEPGATGMLTPTVRAFTVPKGATFGDYFPTNVDNEMTVGYKFAGWFAKIDGVETEITADMICTGDITMTGHWTPTE